MKIIDFYLKNQLQFILIRNNNFKMSNIYYKASELVSDKKITRNNNYKTMMCKNLLNCPYSSNCRFAHSKEELRVGKCMYGVYCKNTKCIFEHTANEDEQKKFLLKIEEEKIKEEEKLKEEEEKKMKYIEDMKFIELDKFIVNFDEEEDDVNDEDEENEEDKQEDEEIELSDMMSSLKIEEPKYCYVMSDEEIKKMKKREELERKIKDEEEEGELISSVIVSQVICPKNKKANMNKYVMSYIRLPEESDNQKYKDNTKSEYTFNLSKLEIDKMLLLMKYLNISNK